MATNKNISITTWYKNKDVAFAIGVDELPIGGSYDGDNKDTFYWYRKENNFWTKHWKPILDKHPWVKYSLGWIPSHTSFLGRFAYTQPTEVKQSELTWKSKTGKQWIKQVLQPIFNYGNKHYDTYVAHGYWHEVPINHYAPYWHPTSRLFKKGKPYQDKTFFDKSLQQLQRAFRYVFKHPANVFNTLPFGEGRPDIPYYFNKHGLYAFGSWLDLSKQEVNTLIGLKETNGAVKTDTLPLGTTIEPEGSYVNGKAVYHAIVGDISYWHQDTRIKGDQYDKVIVVPYALSLASSFTRFKQRVKTMMRKYSTFDAPVLYYFMHAQQNWVDALGGGTLIQSIRTFFEEVGFKTLAQFSKRTAIVIGSVIGLLALIGLFFFPTTSIIVLAALALIGATLTLRIKGLNIKKHDKELAWLHKYYRHRIWTTDFSTLTQYYDMRKQSKLTHNKKGNITINTTNCFLWNQRAIPITIKIKNVQKKIKGYYYMHKNKKIVVTNKNKFDQFNNTVYLYEVMVNPAKENTKAGLLFSN